MRDFTTRHSKSIAARLLPFAVYIVAVRIMPNGAYQVTYFVKGSVQGSFVKRVMIGQVGKDEVKGWWYRQTLTSNLTYVPSVTAAVYQLAPAPTEQEVAACLSLSWVLKFQCRKLDFS